jgi:hypothetical protein
MSVRKIFKPGRFCQVLLFHTAQNPESKDFIDKVLKHSHLAAFRDASSFSAEFPNY